MSSAQTLTNSASTPRATPMPIRPHVGVTLIVAAFACYIMGNLVLAALRLGEMPEIDLLALFVFAVVANIWFVLTFALPAGYLHERKFVMSRLFGGRVFPFENDRDVRIEGGALLINGKRRLRAIGMRPDDWAALVARFGR